MNGEVEHHKAPAEDGCVGVSMLELARLFPDEEAARRWFEAIKWPEGRVCPNCASADTYEVSHVKMPYRCRGCKRYFSVRTGTVMARSPIPLQKWACAVYLDCMSVKGVSSMRLHRDLGVTQKTAWFMRQRIREAFAAKGPAVLLEGPVAVDEPLVNGKLRNRRAASALVGPRPTRDGLVADPRDVALEVW